jgi:prevent-host-death family protein
MVTSATFVTMSRKEKLVPAGEFKAKCLALFDEVEARGRSFVITKRGRPVARVVPLPGGGRGLRGSLVHEEDLLAPVDADWEATT